jgi:hypothetical protein
MKDALWAWEALQRLLEVAAKYSNLLKVWVWIKQREINPHEGGNFIIHDGPVHIC